MGNKIPSVKKSFFYNFIGEVTSLLLPLVSTPYVSRVLHETGVGQYSFSYSIVWYFVLIGTFGFGQYTQRALAAERDDKHRLAISFWENFLAKLLSSSISAVLFVGLILSDVLHDYNILLISCSVLILDCAFNILGYYRAIEDFKAISIRTILIKIIGLVLIFIFVKTEKDVWIYCLCIYGTTFLGNIMLWPKALRQLDRVRLTELNIWKHFFPALKLFLPTIAYTAYTMLDKTLIGFLSFDSDYQNGCYEQAYKIISILTTVITIIGPIMLSRNANLIKNGDKEKVSRNLMFSLNYVWIISIPLIVGTVVLASNITSWLFGEGYIDTPSTMRWLCLIILFMGLSNVFGVQYLLPVKKDVSYGIAIVIGAVTNITLNCILIPRLGAIGAAIGTCVAEGIIAFVDFLMILRLKILTIKELFIMPIRYLVAGCLMFFVMFFLQKYVFDYKIWTFLVIGTIGVLVYFILLLLMKDPFVFWGLNKMKERFKRKRNS